jgi:hypothetical protein
MIQIAAMAPYTAPHGPFQPFLLVKGAIALNEVARLLKYCFFNSSLPSTSRILVKVKAAQLVPGSFPKGIRVSFNSSTFSSNFCLKSI